MQVDAFTASSADGSTIYRYGTRVLATLIDRSKRLRGPARHAVVPECGAATAPVRTDVFLPRSSVHHVRQSLMRALKLFYLALAGVSFVRATPLRTNDGGLAASTWPYKNPNLPIRQRVDDLISRMTLDEKVSQVSLSHPRC